MYRVELCFFLELEEPGRRPECTTFHALLDMPAPYPGLTVEHLEVSSPVTDVRYVSRTAMFHAELKELTTRSKEEYIRHQNIFRAAGWKETND